MEGKKRVFVCGIGNTHYGDDGIGPVAVSELRASVARDDLVFIDCGRSPGRYIGEVISAMPDKVIVISALDMERSPGAVEVLELEDARRMLLSSRKVEAGMFLRYLENSMKGPVFFIGVQPRNSGNGDTMSPDCRSALILLKEKVAGIISS
jgi:hydrogenase 3 maturation protease